MENGQSDQDAGTPAPAAGATESTAGTAPEAPRTSPDRHEGPAAKELTAIQADIAELKGLHKLLHQGQQKLISDFTTHIHQPVEVVHATENAPQAAQAAADTKAEAAAPAVPPSQPEAPASPPVRPQRAGLFNKRGR